MYYLFCFDEFYPSGGANDFKGRFTSVEDALSHLKLKSVRDGFYDYSQLTTSEMQTVVTWTKEELEAMMETEGH